jgi:K+-sensing histidine kinase KdpD
MGKVSEGRRGTALNVIQRNATVQARLIEEVLDVSRIAAGKLDLSLTEIDLSDLVEGGVESAQPLASAKEIRIRIGTRTDGAAVIRGDVRRLQQVVANLVSNVIKFSAEGSEVRVSVEMGDEMADIVVRDWGEGIDPNAIPHIFDRFWWCQSRRWLGASGVTRSPRTDPTTDRMSTPPCWADFAGWARDLLGSFTEAATKPREDFPRRNEPC